MRKEKSRKKYIKKKTFCEALFKIEKEKIAVGIFTREREH